RSAPAAADAGRAQLAWFPAAVGHLPGARPPAAAEADRRARPPLPGSAAARARSGGGGEGTGPAAARGRCPVTPARRRRVLPALLRRSLLPTNCRDPRRQPRG